MTSWRCHEHCAELLGISGAVARFVDRLIDRELDEVLREEGARGHDAVCGLLASPITAAGGLGLSVATLHGVDLLYEILKRYGRLDEEHLKAAVLHCVLDCADQRMVRWDGTYLWRKHPLEMLRLCRDRVVEKWKELYHRYFLFGYPFPTLERIEELAGLADALLRGELERCLLECVVPEAEGKGAPKVGSRAVAELLDCVRKRLGKRAVYCINWQMLPYASATTKIYAELSKGRAVAVGFAEGYGCGQPFVEAKTLGELVEKLLPLCRQ